MVTLHLQSSFAGFDSSASYEKLFALFTKPCNKRKEWILELDRLLILRVADYIHILYLNFIWDLLKMTIMLVLELFLFMHAPTAPTKSCNSLQIRNKSC